MFLAWLCNCCSTVVPYLVHYTLLKCVFFTEAFITTCLKEVDPSDSAEGSEFVNTDAHRWQECLEGVVIVTVELLFSFERLPVSKELDSPTFLAA